MDKVIKFCKRCGTETEHLHIPEGKVYICSVYGCGNEIRTGRKLKETEMYHKLDERETAELRGNWAALTPEQQTKEAKQSLALKFKVSYATIERKLKGDKPAAKKKTRKAAAEKKAPKAPAASHGVFYDAVGKIVDARMEASLDTLRADLPALVSAELMKLLKP